MILAALAPLLILLGIIYRLDQIEREPPGLLWSLFLRGVLAMVPILVLEMLADQFIDFFYWRPMVYLFLAYFVVPGFIEEGSSTGSSAGAPGTNPTSTTASTGLSTGCSSPWALPRWRM